MTTVRSRLTLFTILVVAATLLVLGLFLRTRVEANLMGEVDRGLREDVGAVRTGPAGDLPVINLPKNLKVDHTQGGRTVSAEERRVMQILQSNGDEVRLMSRWDPPKLVPIRQREKSGFLVDDPEGLRRTTDQASFHDFSRKGEPMRSLTHPVRRNGKIVAYAQAIRSLTPVRQAVRDLDRALLASIPVALVLASLGGFVTVGRAMRPLRRMIESAGRLERSGPRLPVEGRDEFAELASALNVAFERQNRALAQLERFTGDAGHELRTPLASIKTSASYLLHIADAPDELRPSLRTIDVSADRMTRLIGDLLLLACHDGGDVPHRREPTDVGELVGAMVEGLAARPGVSVEVREIPSEIVPLDPDAVERVLLNLLTNARDHACERVIVAASVHEGWLTLVVSDDGEGIAPDDLARLGERFFRPDESRSRIRGGVGLGVAIARSLCEAHGGDLTYESEAKRGTTARARFRV